MLVYKPEKLLSAYMSGEFCQSNEEILSKLRAALPFMEPKNYRGISREPLVPWSKIDEDEFQRSGKTLVDLQRDQTARRKFLEINREDRYNWGGDYNTELIQERSAAEEIRLIVDLPEDFEIIEVARGNFGTKYNFLGFDIGYWGGDHYSLICDSAVMPHWHGPDPECFEELGKQLRCLNEHLLFSKPKDAEEFRKYYRSQPWAEEEYPQGEFCIIQVTTVSIVV